MSEAVVIELLKVFTVVGIPFLVALGKQLLDSLPTAKQQKIEHFAGVLVAAAEQTYKSLPGSGDQKKALVEKALVDKANSLGLKITVAELDALIESKVLTLPPTPQAQAPQPGQ